MNTKAWWILVVVLFGVIVGLTWLLFATPAPAPVPNATTTQNGGQTATTTKKLSDRVTVTSPGKNATVGKTFVVAGSAPGPWYFEAVFPIEVRDANNNVLLSTHGTAQGEWMTEGLVTFTATVTIPNYTGPATLILRRDNPSGLPENDDAVSIPIVIQ